MLKSNPDSILMMHLGLEMWLSWFSAHLARTQPEVQSSALHKPGEAVFAFNSSIGEVEEGGDQKLSSLIHGQSSLKANMNSPTRVAEVHPFYTVSGPGPMT